MGYYQQAGHDFTTRAAPLEDLTKKAQPNWVKWSPVAEVAFQDLQEAVCQEPVLVTANFKLLFILYMDASEGGIGAVLSQTFISWRQMKHKQNYATVEKECLAIKWTVGKL